MDMTHFLYHKYFLHKIKDAITIDIAFVSFWSNYIYPSETYLWDLEVYLEELSNEKLYLMQNEILARRGHKFSDPELSVYFKTKSWYKPTTVTSLNELTEAEKYLYNAILEYEAR
jgi:hypothetical protein